MAGRLFVDGAGIATLASTLTSSASATDSAGQTADSALRTLADASQSSPLAGALSEVAERYLGQVTKHAQYVAELSAALSRVGESLEATDTAVAASASRLGMQ